MTTSHTSTRLIARLILCAVLPTWFLACSKEKVAIGQQNNDGQAPDGIVATGGTLSTGGMASTGGVLGAGGNTTGGRTVTGGNVVTGGLTTTGGTVTGGRSATGGSASGGVTATGGAGGTATGGTRLDASTDLPVAVDASTDAGRTCGGIAGLPCGANEFCDPPENMCAVSDSFGTCKPKPQGCTADYQPVCGCDGKTYSNECGRLAAGVSKRSAGECATTTVPCAQLTTQAACDARGDCHSVFVDPQTCGCLGAGCCAKFNRCAVGGRATCTPPSGGVLCDMATPFCESPFVVSYTSTCYEGCVRQTVCSGTDGGVATTTCPQAAPTNGSACSASALKCFYDNCPGTGRTQATCTAGKWVVETGACGEVTCMGVSSTRCPSGQVCQVNAGGAIMAICVPNGCGTGPVSPSCGVGSGCTMSASVTTGVTFTCNTCPQGGCP